MNVSMARVTCFVPARSWWVFGAAGGANGSLFQLGSIARLWLRL